MPGSQRSYSTADLIDQLNPAVSERSRRGMRARFGLKPSERELAEARDEELARTPFSRPVTVMVANPKGGVGKALGVAEPVLTPTGYRAIGKLQVNDLVIGTDGLAYEVFGVYPQGERDLYRVRFSDGTAVLADTEHLWEVQTDADLTEQPGECMTTADLLARGVSSMRADGRTERHHFFVPACAPVKLASTETPLDPYLLGQLLGGGSLTDGTPAYARKNSLIDALRELGVWGHGCATTFVPEAYRLGDIDTRVAVLQGLMDTDGTVDRGAVGCFTTVSDRLAEDVKFIAESLGCVVTRSARDTRPRHKGDERVGRPCHTLRITPPQDLQLFRLERKAAAMRPPRRRPFRAITDITPDGRGEAVCIAVASPDRLFLTRSCVPTHNTPTTLLLAAAFGTCRGGGVIAWDNNELRGTMPDRSLSPHRRTVRDLLDATDQLAAPQSQFTDLAVFLNHQTPGKFHTLGSAQSFGHVVSHENFLTIHGILSRYFQIIVVDTGNNEASPNWLAAAERADCLVVPTKWRKDSLIPAARMLETLREKQPELLDRAVIVATNGPADSQEDVKRNGASWFGSSHPIVEIPTDPHIAEGGVIDWSKLQPRTRRAGLSLAAQVAERISTVA